MQWLLLFIYRCNKNNYKYIINNILRRLQDKFQDVVHCVANYLIQVLNFGPNNHKKPSKKRIFLNRTNK